MSQTQSFRSDSLTKADRGAFRSFLTEKGISFFKLDSDSCDEFRPRKGITSLVKSGKVRNMYTFNTMIFETSNRLSVFDKVIKEDVPLKGCMLNMISQHNKQFLEKKGICTDYVEAPDNQLFRRAGFGVRDFNKLALSKILEMFPLEFIVRGYIVGSAWKAYSRGESFCGFIFPKGLYEGQKLEKPILTPTTKAENGHDMPVDVSEAVMIVANWISTNNLNIISSDDIEEICRSHPEIAQEIFEISDEAEEYAADIMEYTKVDFDYNDWWDYYEYALEYEQANYYVNAIYQISLNVFKELSEELEKKGILFIDSKFEFGLDEYGNICLGDEVGTPDSSRFAPADIYENTGKIVSMDKQIVRDYCSQMGFTGDEGQEIPELPAELWKKVTDTYVHIAELICGHDEVVRKK